MQCVILARYKNPNAFTNGIANEIQNNFTIIYNVIFSDANHITHSDYFRHPHPNKNVITINYSQHQSLRDCDAQSQYVTVADGNICHPLSNRIPHPNVLHTITLTYPNIEPKFDININPKQSIAHQITLCNALVSDRDPLENAHANRFDDSHVHCITCIHPYAHIHSLSHTTADAIRHTYRHNHPTPIPDPDPHPNCHPGRHPHAGPNTDPYPHAESHEVAYPLSHLGEHSHCLSIAHAVTHADPNPAPHRHRHPHSHPHTDTYAFRNLLTYAHSNVPAHRES